MDCCNFDDLLGVPDSLFASEDILAVRCSAFRGGICGNIADGGNEHVDSKSSAG